ncbi:unnamed protein product [Cyprideis torosa]|uniref:Elongation of very long chain fatty acids protein n=1 Tax=Cyprideis torosa TaxID=163714 RepID=A0A7R8WEG3_9CRUS|nr:unnamed protein product [Cyprideis torosa]CAG0890690.1 unnamed protein product [Cyprideis torosa]
MEHANYLVSHRVATSIALTGGSSRRSQVVVLIPGDKDLVFEDSILAVTIDRSSLLLRRKRRKIDMEYDMGINEMDPRLIPGTLMNFTVHERFRKEQELMAAERVFDIIHLYLWFREHAWISVVMSAFYLTTVFVLMKIMKNRPGFELKGPLIVWNSVLAIFSTIGAYRCSFFTLKEMYHYGFHQSACRGRIFTPLECLWEVLFTASKAVEFGDTFFLILRKRPVGFLQVYHHGTVLMFSWYSLAYDNATKRLFASMNFTVHSVMYTYFALKALGIFVPKPIAKSITTLQMSQFALGLFITCSSLFFKVTAGCDSPAVFILLNIIMYISMLGLFRDYFKRSYTRGEPKKVD